MNHRGSTVLAVALAVVATATATTTATRAWAADPAPATSADVARLQAEVARLQSEIVLLQQELREQRQLVTSLIQTEQQRYDVLLQLVRAQGGNTAGAPPALPALPTLSPRSAAGGARAAGGTSTGNAAAGDSADASAAGVGHITGKVTLPADGGEAYVYVEGLRGGPAARPHQVEIRQKEKQFSPQVVAVPVGSRLVFPNVDTVFHNVFSATPGHAFDVGTVKGGETSRAVPLTKSGHLEIFCNIHRKMRADVLVVPNGYFAKVAPDGSFDLAGVPAGSRKVVLWGPNIKTTSQQVDVTPKGATLRITAQSEPTKPHLNKLGQVYGSYDD